MERNYDDTLIRIERESQNVYPRLKCSKKTKITDFMITENEDVLSYYTLYVK